MKISRIIIKKFRSIDTADIWVSSVNAIVGQNNAGKSCLLRALNAFFNYDKEELAFISGSHSFAPRTISKIEIHFDEIDLSKVASRFIYNKKMLCELNVTLNAKGCTPLFKYKQGRDWITDSSVIQEIKKHIEFILIPPNRDASALDRMENNVLQMLVEEKMKEATETRDNYTTKFKKAIEYLETGALKKIAVEAKSEFPVNKGLNLSIKYKKEISYKSFLPDVGITIDESGLSHALSECGSGIQSLTIISLYNLLGKAREENIIIGLEEPETNLHPQAQKELISYFKELVNAQNILQLFFTTHSPNMVDQVDHTDIIIFKKIVDQSRGFRSIVKRLPKDFFEKHSLDDFKYYQFYRYRNSDFFFSSHVVITESKNEVEIIKRIGETSDFDYEINGLSYLNLDGVDKAKYTIHLFKELDIPFFLIVDKDFFFPYLNGEYDNSLGASGFPIYKEEFKDEDLVKHLVGDARTRQSVLQHVNTNHTEMLNILEPYGVVSMRYSLDLDLVAIERAQEKYYHLLNILNADRAPIALTTKRKAIKKIARIIEVFEDLEPKNWPYSFSRIRKIMGVISKNLKATR